MEKKLFVWSGTEFGACDASELRVLWMLWAEDREDVRCTSALGDEGGDGTEAPGMGEKERSCLLLDTNPDEDGLSVVSVVPCVSG